MMTTPKTIRVFDRTQRFLTSTAIGLVSVQIATTWSIICGVSPESLTTLFVAIAFGLLAADELRRRIVASPIVFTSVLATIVAAMSCMLAGVFEGALQTNVSLASASPLLCFVLPGIVASVVTATAILWLCGGEGFPDQVSANIHKDRAIIVCGTCVGLLASFMQGFVVLPLALPVCVTCALATALRLANTGSNSSTLQHSVNQSAAATTDWRLLISTVGVGLFVANSTRIISAQIPITFSILIPAVVLLLVGSFAVSFANRRGWLAGPVPQTVCGLSPLALPLTFGYLIELNLNLNAQVSSVAVLFGARALQLAALWLTGIICWTIVGRPPRDQASPDDTTDAVLRLAAMFCLGLAMSCGLRLSAGLNATAGLIAGFSLMCMPLVRRQAVATGRRAVVVTAALTGVGLLIGGYSRATATQLLFSSQAAQSHREGSPLEVIAQSNGFRLVQEQDTPAGYLTIWKTSGDQTLLRRDGFPAGETSTNTATAPQPVADVFPTLLPLLMHENASSVLLLGDETGAAVRMCSEFPLHTIVASRPDADTTHFATQATWRLMNPSPLQDDRFTICEEPVAVTVRRPSSAGRFDVVVAGSPNPTTLSALEQLTPEFYAAVKRQLSENGVFCQRITRHDLGSLTMVRLVSTLAEQFSRVVLIQTAPGEIALVAGATPNSLLDSKLLSRMERQHVTRALSGSGWDWSQLAALPAIDTGDPVGIFEHTSRLPAASAANVHFAFALPAEVSAWRDKNTEMREAFGPHQQRIADAADRGAAYQEFARRLSAVINQSEILTSFPDQPWPYRRSLRTEMQRNQRPPVEVRRNGDVHQVADPRDERRKDYFITLGQVLQQAKSGMVDPLNMRALAGFTQTYEPLLSYFAHHELVRVHEVTGHPSPALELRHRLHTVYFAESGDMSIRQITDTLSQLLEDPELVSDSELRYDHVNSMLQKMVHRWNLRRSYEPGSAHRTQQAVETSIAVAKRGLNALNEWSDSVGVTPEEMAARRKYIHRSLVSPLRSYQEQVLAHRIKTESPIITPLDEGSGGLPMLLDPEDVLSN